MGRQKNHQANDVAEKPKSALPFWEVEWQSQITRLKTGQPPFETEVTLIDNVDLMYEAETSTPDGRLVKQPFRLTSYRKGEQPPTTIGQAILKLLVLFRRAEAALGSDLFAENQLLTEHLDAAMKDRERLALQVDVLQSEIRALKEQQVELAETAE